MGMGGITPSHKLEIALRALGEKENFIFNTLHYLSFIERKTNAPDQVAPLQG